ncbi:MAG: diguanylate cyclase, partial [Desulfocapsaceae bacterium]|nr:diguanylate cyclase [Desulfocapsaceae bacterium]
MENELTILIVASGRKLPGIDLQALADKGFNLIYASFSANIRSQCRRHSADLVITGPPENKESTIFLRQDLPSDVPILCLGSSSPDRRTFPGIINCFQDSLSQTDLLGQIHFLLRVKTITDTVARKDAEHKELAARLEQQQQSMELHSEFLDIVALRDGLTGLYNRRHLNTLLPKTFEKCTINGSELSMLIIDIDYFYELNKSAGTSFGDFILNDFAARLTAASQPNGTCFRFSGETFIVLLEETDLPEAAELAESIRGSLTLRPFIRNNEQRTISVSSGIVSLIDHQPQNPDEFLSMAERALFSAKADGRDRIAIFNGRDAGTAETTRHNLNFLKETLSRILMRTRASSLDSLQVLARDIGGSKNRGHIENVRNYVELLGNHMNLPETTIETFRNAVALHTSIRFLLHNEMISKEEIFTEDDRETMADFPFKLAEITEMFDYFSNERAILLYHGERYDGNGYPDGLRGEEIPLGARIFALVDALAAMNEDRPHRRRLAPEQVLTELVEGAGRQFDPDLVIRVLKLIKSNQLL